jgi:hypothetical protein
MFQRCQIRTHAPQQNVSLFDQFEAGSDKLPGAALVGCSQPTLKQRCFSMVPAGAGSSIRGKACSLRTGAFPRYFQ